MEEIEQQTKLEKFTESLKSFKSQVFKSEALRIGIPVFLGLILLLFIIPFFFNNSALKFKIAQKASQVSGANVTINGKVSFSLVPSPTVILRDVVVQNYKTKDKQKIYNLYAKEAHLKMALFSSDNFAKKIILEDAIVESYEAAYQPEQHANDLTKIIEEITKNAVTGEEKKIGTGLSSKLFSVDGLDVMKPGVAGLPNIEIKNSGIIIYDRLGRMKQIKMINAEAKISEEKISAKGNFTSEEILSNFKLTTKFKSTSTKHDSVLEVISPVMQLRVSGNFSSENRGFFASDFKGKIEAEILELKSFYKSYISANNVVFNKLKYNAKPLKISADLLSGDKEIAVHNVTFTSSLMNGKGDIDVNFAGKIPLIDVVLNLEDIDLDSTWSREAIMIAGNGAAQNHANGSANEVSESLPQQDPAQAVTETAPAENKPGEIPTTILVDEAKKIKPIDFEMAKAVKDFDLAAEIKIKNIKYLEGEIKDANLYLTVSERGEILILPMVFRIPGEGTFRVNGVLDNSTELPKFVGKFDASGKSLKEIFKWLKIESQNLKFDNLKEYSLYSDLLLTPNAITLNNFYLNLNNNQSEFLGELKIDNSNKSTSIISRFESDVFNIDDYFLTSGQNIYLSPGSLIKKLLWLNDMSSNNDLTLRFGKLIYKGEEFLDQSVKLRFGRGYIEVADLDLRSSQTSLKANMAIDISDKNPKFDLNIVADNFHYETAQKSQLIVDGAIPESHKIKKQNFFDQFFALPSLEGFNGKITLSVDDLKLDGFAVTDLKLAGALRDGNIENSELTCGFFDGDFSYKGMIGLKQSKIVNGNLQFTNASIQPLLSSVAGIENISGIANISANITGTANKKDEFAKEITSEIKFSANSPTVEGYGLNELVKKMFNISLNREELRDPEKILLNPRSKTTFKQASGTIQILAGKDGKIRINAAAPAVNGILSGTINASTHSMDALFNAIFLTGSRQKQTPINIATNLKGNLNMLSQSTNLDQAKQYLGLIKGSGVPLKAIEPEPQPTDNPAVNSQIEEINKRLKEQGLTPLPFTQKQ